LLVLTATIPAFSQVENGTDKQTVRVTMTVNADGSHTSYQFDPANGKATAVTTEKDGKTRETIKYELDEKARFASGVVSGPDGRFKFKSIYKYDAAGHLEEETHLGKDSAVINRLVYSFDPTGKPTGYSVFDASGKLMGKTSSPNPSSPAKTSPSKTSPK
jgi:hypothetical protein